MGFIWNPDAACAERSVRKKVNDMSPSGPAMPGRRALAADNAGLDKRDLVTIDLVREHCGRHFPFRRRPTPRTGRSWNGWQGGGPRLRRGCGHAITPIAFFETIMVKSYETLVDSDTKVDADTGIVAAGRAAIADRFEGPEPRTVGVEGPVGPDQRCGHVHSPESMWARSSRRSRSWSSIRRRSTSAWTPSMTRTTTPTTRRVHRRRRRVLTSAAPAVVGVVLAVGAQASVL